jgi:Fe-S cluster biogenesis protein NfuA
MKEGLMFIQTENTPNPATVKFIPGTTVMESGVAQFNNGEEAAKSPLAEKLFAITGVVGVFFGADFISITKTEAADWSLLKAPVMGSILQHFSTQAPLFRDGGGAAAEVNDDLLDEISKQVKELIEKRVRPAVAMDGGDISFEKFDKGIVYLRLSGACSGCPSSTITLKNGVENMLRHYVPEVLEVRQVQDY